MKSFILCLLFAAALGQSDNSALFKAIDLNGDGILKMDEALDYFAQKDRNGDRRVSLIEYTASPPFGLTPISVQATYNYYDQLDGNGDGVIDQSVVEFLYKILDANDDGEITGEEYEMRITNVTTFF